MPSVSVVTNGARLVLRFDDGEVVRCNGVAEPPTESQIIGASGQGHRIGVVGEKQGAKPGRMVPAFIFDPAQRPVRGQPLFNHTCTVCGATVSWPEPTSETF